MTTYSDTVDSILSLMGEYEETVEIGRTLPHDLWPQVFTPEMIVKASGYERGSDAVLYLNSFLPHAAIMNVCLIPEMGFSADFRWVAWTRRERMDHLKRKADLWVHANGGLYGFRR